MAPPGSPWCEFTVVMFLGLCTRGVEQGPVALMSSDMVEARDLARGFCRGGCCRAVGTTVPGSGVAGKLTPGQRPDLWDVSLEYGQLEESGGGLGMETTTSGLTQGRVQSCVDMDHLLPVLLGSQAGTPIRKMEFRCCSRKNFWLFSQSDYPYG